MGKSIVLLLFLGVFLVNIDAGRVKVSSKEERECLQFVRSVKGHINTLIDGDKSMLMNFTDALCKRFPEHSCDDYKEKLTKVLAMTSVHFQPRKICSALYPGLSIVLKTIKMKDDPAVCKACKAVVSFVKMEIEMFNETTEKIKEGIQKMCALLPLKVQKEMCNDITNYIEEIIQKILEGATPGTICVDLKLCNSTQMHKLSTNLFMKMLPKIQKKMLPKIKTTIKQMGFFNFKDTPIMCKACKLIVAFIKMEVKVLNESTEEIKKGIQAACALLAPLKIQKELCNDITNYIEEIIQKILTGVTPGAICVDLKLCNSTQMHELSSLSFMKILPKLKSTIKQMGLFKTLPDMKFLSKIGMKKRLRPHHRFRPKHRPFQLSHRFTRFNFRPFHPRFLPYRPRHHRFHPHFRPRSKHHPSPDFWKGFMKNSQKKIKGIYGNLFKKMKKHMFTKPTDETFDKESDLFTTNKPIVAKETTMQPAIKTYPVTKQPITIPESTKDIDARPIEPTSVTNENVPEVVDRIYEITEGENTISKDKLVDGKNTVVEESGPAFDDPFSTWFDEEDKGDERHDWDFGDYDGDYDGEHDGDKGVIEGSFDDETEEPPTKEWGDFENIREKVGESLFKGIFDDETEEPPTKKGGDFDSIREKVGKPLFKGIFDHFKKPSDDLFGGLTPDFPSSIFPKSFEGTLESLKESTSKNFRKFTKEVETNVTHSLGGVIKEGITCTICQTIVKVITWEIKTVNASIKFIENEVKVMCALYPIKAAQEACDVIIDKVDEIIQLIEKGAEPGSICQQIGLCNTTLKSGVKTVTAITPTSKCKPLCKFFKGLYSDDMKKTAELWVSTKKDLVEFCAMNKNPATCENLLRIFNKAERQLGAVINSDDTMLVNEKQKQKEDNDFCKCFKNQPIFITKKFNKCQRCKEMEKGLIKDLTHAKISMEYLVETMHKFCKELPESKSKCMKILVVFNTSFVRLEQKLLVTDLCPTLGYCGNNKTDAIIQDMSKVEIPGFGGKLFPSFPNVWKKFSFGCQFCQKCIDNIQRTLKYANETNTEDVIPALKDGFSIYCHSQGDGQQVTQVCKTISNGMETIQKVVKKTEDAPSMCRTFGMC